MNLSQPFSCLIVGEGTLPIRCAEVLLAHDMRINGIISSDSMIQHWTLQKKIPYFHPKEDLMALIKHDPCDYLFSIVNPHILPKELLILPKRYAVNYHNALLPKYGGSYATSWALINRERTHGITWHMMSEQVDAGDILKQRTIEIIPGETALTLNAKCYKEAIRAFAELVDDLCHGAEIQTKQDLGNRTFFLRSKRPSSGCVISWNQCAEEIDALIRGLDFGLYPNPLGLPKLAIGNDFVTITRCEIRDTTSSAAPGTVMGIDDRSLTIATTTRDISLQKLLDTSGQPISIGNMAEKFGIYEGFRLTDLPLELRARLTELHTACSKHENFWTKRISNVRPFTLPKKTRLDHESGRSYANVPLDLPKTLQSYIFAHGQDLALSELLLATFAIYLSQLSGTDSFDIGYTHTELIQELNGLENFFATRVPLRVHLDLNRGFSSALNDMVTQVKSIELHKTYARDMIVRYPVFHSTIHHRAQPIFPVSAVRITNENDYHAATENDSTRIAPEPRTDLSGFKEALTLFVCKGENSLKGSLRYAPDLFNSVLIGRIVEHVHLLLKLVVADPEKRLHDLPPYQEQYGAEFLEAIQWVTEQSWRMESTHADGREEGEL